MASDAKKNGAAIRFRRENTEDNHNLVTRSAKKVTSRVDLDRHAPDTYNVPILERGAHK